MGSSFGRLKILSLLPQIMVFMSAFLLVFLMKFLGHPEIMLPTFGALMTGAWLVKTNLWHYNKRRLILFLPLSAVIGLLLSIYFGSLNPLYVYPCLYVAFLATAAVLIFGRTQIYPCFGAAVLPILFQMTSWLYPLSVFILALVLAAGRILLERLELLPHLPEGEDSDFPKRRRERIKYYLLTSLGVIPALIFVPFMGDHFWLLPPMFVTYTTFCNQHSSFTKYPVQTWIQICIAVSVGLVLCGLENTYFASILDATGFCVVYALGAGVAVLVTMCVGRRFHLLFPPAMSFALTPFLTGFNPWIFLYVPVMCSYFIAISWLMRRHPAYSNGDLKYL